jgi:hypothetical protein
MLMVSCWISLAVSRVLESLKNCTNIVIKVVECTCISFLYIYVNFPAANTRVIANLIFNVHCLLDQVILAI